MCGQIKSELPGVSIDLDNQASNLEAICMPYQDEYSSNVIYEDGVSNHFGPGYGYIEAQALHAFVRHYKPKRIVEIGSGVSTYCIVKADEINNNQTGKNSEIISIEPYPSERLRGLSQIKLVCQKVQSVPLEVFTDLAENDLLFIDSSHTVKTGGDVNYLFLEVLPRLRKGVVVHIHDIYLPYDYQRDADRTFLHWSETSLLHAFLICNEKMKIIACLSHVHYERKDVLRKIFPKYNPQEDLNGLSSERDKSLTSQVTKHFPSSIYIQVQ